MRQNVLWGIKQCCVGTAEQLGEEIGADGWEISYHSNPKPSHEAMGGRQYAAGDEGVTVDGKYYPLFSNVADLLQDFNCLHYKMPILRGISEPAYDEDELASMKANDRLEFEYEGKKYTGYEATQVQRKLETDIRRQKDRANIFAASGDDDGRRVAQEKINLLTKKYKSFSDAAGLPYKTERMSVAKFHRVKTAAELKRNQLTNAAGQRIIKAKKTTLTGTPNTITQVEGAKGGIERNYYGADGKQYKQISNNDHGHPKQHPYGNHGEHAHDYIYDENGKLKSRPTRELTAQEREDNKDIL